MIRKIIAVVVGFVLWSIFWLTYGQVVILTGLYPESGEPITGFLALAIMWLGSVIISLVTGYITTAIARSGDIKITVALGVILLMVGTAVQVQFWELLPVWYHVLFLTCLIPACIVGGRLRR